MNATEAKKTLFEIRKNLIDDKQKHAIWLAIKAIDYCVRLKKGYKWKWILKKVT